MDYILRKTLDNKDIDFYIKNSHRRSVKLSIKYFFENFKNYMKIKFSIIVKSLNSRIYLNKCLKSILNQSYKNFEIIVIDGGSNDGTIDYLKTFVKNKMDK